MYEDEYLAQTSAYLMQGDTGAGAPPQKQGGGANGTMRLKPGPDKDLMYLESDDGFKSMRLGVDPDADPNKV